MDLLRDEQTDALASLEERILKAADLVRRLRQERDVAVQGLEKAVAERDAVVQELEALRAERKQVRTRIEKLLGQMDLLSAG
ncbi:MAG TPA: cell division protein ZapB [Bryobacteraceae bacterium]|nr:cell division protein ZapB [Bryobacteraceae bacterium]